MKNETVYENAPYGVKEALDSPKVVEDFIPSPEKLIPKEETKKVTIALSQKSIDFFKEISKKNHVPYQQMIRKVLDSYADYYAK